MVPHDLLKLGKDFEYVFVLAASVMRWSLVPRDERRCAHDRPPLRRYSTKGSRCFGTHRSEKMKECHESFAKEHCADHHPVLSIRKHPG